MKSGKWIGAAVAAALAAGVPLGCQQPTEKNKTAGNDPWADNVAAQVAKPESKASADNLAENVKNKGGVLSGRLYMPTGEPSTSALLIEKAMPAEVQANKPFMYDIKVTNIAKLKLEGVEVQETVPGNFKIKDVTEGTPDGKPNTIPYSIGTLNAGESKILRLQGTATQSGPLGMCLSATYNTSLCMATTVVAPSLKLAVAGPADALLCEMPQYKLTVTNNGSGQAKNVRVESVLPDGLTTPDGKAAVAFDSGTLAAGESREHAFTVKAAKTGKYDIKATAKAEENLASEPATVVTAIKQPVLAIAMTGPEKGFIGQQVAYEITVTNKGDGVAKNVVLTDMMPKDAKMVVVSEGGRADNAGRVSWNYPELAPGESKKVAVVVTYDQAGKLETGAAVSAVCADQKIAQASTALTGIPAILLEVQDTPDPVRVGDQTTYTIEVTNQGTAAGTNIKLVCTMEDPMDFISASGQTKEKVDGKTITFGTIPSLPPKTKLTYKVTVKAKSPADVRFKTSMTSDQLGRPVEETEATNFYGQ
jgi:uncharacterized repeat protein (TIGR01451 family)